MSVYPDNLCIQYLSEITSSDLPILNSIAGSSNKDVLISSLGLVTNGGTISDSTINLNLFYTWWKNPLNSSNIATIISTDVDNNACKDVRQYNEYLLRIFFCNKSPEENFYPKIEGKNVVFISQLNNLHYYFANQGGGGLGYCNNQEQPLLKSFCQDITPTGQNTGQFISGNPDYFSWCGCYAQQSEFAKEFTPNFTNLQQLSCNPLCNYYNSIKLYEEKGTGYQQVECSETICVIDDVSVRAIDSDGKINFKQICKGCDNQAGNCLCIIDTSVKGILDKINAEEGGTQDPVSFDQVCPGAQCYSVDSNGIYRQLKCNPNNKAYTNQDPFFGYNGDGFLRDITDEDKLNDNDYLGMFFITILLIFFLIIAFIGLHDMDTQIKKQKNQLNTKPTVKPSMKLTLDSKYTPGQVNAFNKSKYAPLD